MTALPQPRSILRTSGPRVVRDSVGPILCFYLGWKLVGLVVGIAVATLVGIGLVVHERHRGRPGAIARLALAIVFIRAAVGLISGSAKVYLAQDPVADVLLGSLFLGSVLVGRPITAVLAGEIYPFPPEARESRTYGEVFRRVTLAWVGYFFTVAAVRLTVLLVATVDVYVVVSVLTGAPFIIAMLIWSIRYTLRAFRASPELGPLIAALEATDAEPAATR